MQLDYFDKTGRFVLKVPRSSGVNIKELMLEHGLDYSSSKSTPDMAYMFTGNNYAAMTYAEHATPRAIQQLGPWLPELEASRHLGYAANHPIGEKAQELGYSLYDFQNAGVDYVTRRPHALIGDSPGLGKTPMAIVTANVMQAKSVLVVCPAAIRLQWAKQIHIWSTMPGRFITYPILKTSDGVHPNAQWTIVSFDLLRSAPIWAALAERRFDLIVVDEAHYLKNSSSGRTAAMFGNTDHSGLASKAGSILALTGTPLPNRPRECFTLAKALCWDSIDYMSENAFCERYNPIRVGTTKKGKTYTQEKSGRLFELQNRLRSNFMVRRKKRDVLTQLPAISYEVVDVEPSGRLHKLLQAEKALDIDPDTFQLRNFEQSGELSTIRRLMGVEVAPFAADYAKMILDGGEEKLVVFCWHLEVLDILETKLRKYGVVRVDGSTSAAHRQMRVDDFQREDGPRVFIGNLQSIGTGVDGLQNVCNRGLFAECDWVPGNNFEQGVGRLERIGQNFGIFVEFLVPQDSIIAKIMGRALEKLKDIHNALDERF